MLHQLRPQRSPDYVHTSADGAVQRGGDSGVAVAEKYTTAFPDLSFELRHRHSPRDDVSVIEFTATGTHRAELEGIPATGRRIEVLVCNVIEVEHGKIVREREYFDSMSLIDQLGPTGDA